MDDLFSTSADDALAASAPLAVRMRPRTLDEIVGQDEVVGPGTFVRHAVQTDTLTSVILYGPPGCGKTTLARVIARASQAHFEEISAVTSGVKEVRALIDQARNRLAMTGKRTIVFIDEIHRFNKTQQDALLHAVEDRLIVLVGATTENPFFEVAAPLISRSRVIVMRALSDDAVRTIVRRAVSDAERGLGGQVVLEPAAEDRIVLAASGDARAALTALELAASIAPRGRDGLAHITAEHVAEVTQTRHLRYDKAGDEHYDLASAFIKSMRGSDPDAAVYYLARMIAGGEDPKFIARRMLIFASEDVGMADPQALSVAHAAVKAAEFVGLPECRINLAHAAIYLALAPKSNACYRAIDEAMAEVEAGPATAVPEHLRDRHRPGAETYPEYVYPHDRPAEAASQTYLPPELAGRRFYRPKDEPPAPAHEGDDAL
ncbi:replication-associated recombination protein A [Coriobacteriia bacterium Es71-Z0120]|uniref:replication-associated recombination protein A n=1 Tax=Parvivirga hydrogeniphila TaxID=2939460 RepID=UPI002260D747|nr:replication-associated recombination protein A [Parvivirga hydrogeniphila]MCL4079175.1 replication-associated recombination protein A [Parvivirga hydrogeniphila]